MIEVDPRDGPGRPLVRGLAACLASVTETALDDLPDVSDGPVEHALGAWTSWPAGRGSGLDIRSAWAVASLSPVLAPVASGAALSGVVDILAVAPQAEAPCGSSRAPARWPGEA